MCSVWRYVEEQHIYHFTRIEDNMAFGEHINSFLLNGDDDDNLIHHRNECFCRRCRQYFRSLIEGEYGQTEEEKIRQITELGNKMKDELPAKLKAAKKNLYTVTKEIIVYGGLYRDAALSGSRYKQFKSWATVQPRYQELVNGNKKQQKEFSDHCQLINDCANVYESWDIIVSHLTNESITFLDAKTFSVDYFRRSKNWVWCVSENERASVRGGKRKRPAAEKLWTSQDVDQGARQLLAINRLREADVFTMAQFCQQVERQCLEIVKRKHQILDADTTAEADTTNDLSNLLSP